MDKSIERKPGQDRAKPFNHANTLLGGRKRAVFTTADERYRVTISSVRDDQLLIEAVAVNRENTRYSCSLGPQGISAWLTRIFSSDGSGYIIGEDVGGPPITFLDVVLNLKPDVLETRKPEIAAICATVQKHVSGA